jgi:hypothetical protein
MTGPEHDDRGSNPLVRLLDWLGELLQVPPDETRDDPLLTGIEDLPPEEQAARKRVWWDQFRRGRDGG